MNNVDDSITGFNIGFSEACTVNGVYLKTERKTSYYKDFNALLWYNQSSPQTFLFLRAPLGAFDHIHNVNLRHINIKYYYNRLLVAGHGKRRFQQRHTLCTLRVYTSFSLS